jgi:hypothetical protein
MEKTASMKKKKKSGQIASQQLTRLTSFLQTYEFKQGEDKALRASDTVFSIDITDNQ